ncbi:hypothetical protein AAC387_Pa11g0351 [Persea americana]
MDIYIPEEYVAMRRKEKEAAAAARRRKPECVTDSGGKKKGTPEIRPSSPFRVQKTGVFFAGDYGEETVFNYLSA